VVAAYFGWPWQLDALELPADVMRMVLHDNAARILS
jgi:hypothetical protein